MKIVTIFSLSFILFAWQVCAQCPSGWTRHETSCYHFSHDKEPWMLAHDVCKAFGSNLADITTKSEDTFLQNEVQRLKVNHWVGGNDLMNEGEWTWISTNEDIEYTNWLTGEPNNRNKNENCMDLRSVPGWNDEQCINAQNYICERPANDMSIVG